MQMWMIYFRFVVAFMLLLTAATPLVVGAHGQFKRGCRNGNVYAYVLGVLLTGVLIYVCMLCWGLCWLVI